MTAHQLVLSRRSMLGVAFLVGTVAALPVTMPPAAFAAPPTATALAPLAATPPLPNTTLVGLL